MKTRVAGRFLARLFRNLHNYACGITIGRKGKGRECNDLGGCAREIGPVEDGRVRRAKMGEGKGKGTFVTKFFGSSSGVFVSGTQPGGNLKLVAFLAASTDPGKG